LVRVVVFVKVNIAQSLSESQNRQPPPLSTAFHLPPSVNRTATLAYTVLPSLGKPQLARPALVVPTMIAGDSTAAPQTVHTPESLPTHPTSLDGPVPVAPAHNGPALSASSPDPSGHNALCLDSLFFPHIVDVILLHAPYETLLSFRATSKTFRERVDRLMMDHIFIGPTVRRDCSFGDLVLSKEKRRIPSLLSGKVDFVEDIRVLDGQGAVISKLLPDGARKVARPVWARGRRTTNTILGTSIPRGILSILRTTPPPPRALLSSRRLGFQKRLSSTLPTTAAIWPVQRKLAGTAPTPRFLNCKRRREPISSLLFLSSMPSSSAGRGRVTMATAALMASGVLHRTAPATTLYTP